MRGQAGRQAGRQAEEMCGLWVRGVQRAVFEWAGGVQRAVFEWVGEEGK